MKIAAFSVRPDEKQYFDTFANVYKVELQINRSGFTADDIESVKGCEAMSVCDGMCDTCQHLFLKSLQQKVLSISVSGQSDITVLTLRQQSALESVLHTADIRHIQLPIIQ